MMEEEEENGDDLIPVKDLDGMDGVDPGLDPTVVGGGGPGTGGHSLLAANPDHVFNQQRAVVAKLSRGDLEDR